MIINIRIVRVDTDYCDYLRKYDNKVAYNKNEKELRPFIGILFKIDNCEYFAPLSSPKSKHKNMKNTVDFFKINGGKLGAVNFNNMIPVNKNNYSLVDLNKETLTIAELKYQKLLIINYSSQHPVADALSFMGKIFDFAHEHFSLNYITNSKNISNHIQNLFNIIILKSLYYFIRCELKHEKWSLLQKLIKEIRT